MAAGKGHEAVVRLLLEGKASVDAAAQVSSRIERCGGIVRRVCMAYAGLGLGWLRKL